MLGEVGDPCRDERHDHVPQRRDVADPDTSALVQVGKAAAQRGVVNRLLRLVVEVDRPLRDLSLACDAVHRRALEPAFPEYAHGGGHEHRLPIRREHVFFAGAGRHGNHWVSMRVGE